MEEVIVEHIDDFETFVNTMKLNTRYMLPKTCRYKWVKIEQDTDSFTKEVKYGWVMEYNYHTSGGFSGYIFPMRSKNYVKFFKTEAGAKQNFFQKYVDVFEPIAKEVRERDNKLKQILNYA